MPRRMVGPSASMTSVPSTSMDPPLGSMSRLTMRRIVDLPQPDGPTRATSSPRRTSRSRPPDGDRAVRVLLADAGQADHRARVVRGRPGDGRGGAGAGSVRGVTWAVHAQSVAESCLQRNAWVCPEYVRTRSDILLEALVEHLGLTFAAVALGLLVALPLGCSRAGRGRWRRARRASRRSSTRSRRWPCSPCSSRSGLPFGPSIVVVGLAIYTLGILLRNIVVGLHGVPEDALDAATGMGLSARRRLWSVELPLALPAILAGLRIATVSTVALVTVGGLFGFGGLGNLIINGQRTQFNAEVLTATVLVVAVALALDGLLLLLERRATPWARGRAA